MTTTPTPTTKQVCSALKADGKPCRAYAVQDSQYCHFHAPERSGEATAARKAGGKARSKPSPAEPIDLSTPELQRRAIETTIDRVRSGDETSNVARLVLYGISLARPIVEAEEIVKRLDALEQAARG